MPGATMIFFASVIATLTVALTIAAIILAAAMFMQDRKEEKKIISFPDEVEDKLSVHY